MSPPPESITMEFTPQGMIIECDGFKGSACNTETDKIIKFFQDNGVDVKKKDVRMKGDMSANTSKASAATN